MPRRNVIRSLKLDEISGVDNPAQEGARVSIMKRASLSKNGYHSSHPTTFRNTTAILPIF